MPLSLCACVCARVRVRVRACVCVCVLACVQNTDNYGAKMTELEQSVRSFVDGTAGAVSRNQSTAQDTHAEEHTHSTELGAQITEHN